jgi:predicted acetylornithine/succinylornithine family transaminase
MMTRKKNAFARLAEAQKNYVLQTYPPQKIMLVKGKGAEVTDSEGKTYLDFAAGIAVCNLGHCHPAVTKAVKHQVSRLVHVSNLYMNDRQPELAEKLIKKAFDGAVFFCNSGAEANEGLIKLARKWGSDKGRHEIIAMEDSFHGRTLATLAATGRSKYREGFQPDMPGFKFVPFNNFEAAEKAVSEKTAAILLEPIQGEGGVRPADPEYLKKIRALCDKKGILLLFDEVQCGMGRSGTLFAWQGFKVEPDAFSLAKALGNGYPIGAFIAQRKHTGVLTAGTHASTFGGTPLACAAACAVLDTFDKKNILANCVKRGNQLVQKLQKIKHKFKCVREIRGRGLLIGAELDFKASELLPFITENGMLALSAGETVLRLAPPLTVTSDEIDRAAGIIEKSLRQFMEKRQNA